MQANGWIMLRDHVCPSLVNIGRDDYGRRRMLLGQCQNFRDGQSFVNL
jgi:hypothetical protein